MKKHKIHLVLASLFSAALVFDLLFIKSGWYKCFNVCMDSFFATTFIYLTFNGKNHEQVISRRA